MTALSAPGPNFATRGNLSEYLALALNSVCGRWARAGEPLIRPNVLLPAFDARAQPYAPYRAWGYGEKLRVRGLTNAACGMPTAALADEILLDGERQVKALICLGGFRASDLRQSATDHAPKCLLIVCSPSFEDDQERARGVRKLL